MQLGGVNYQYTDSYFVIAHPFTYILIGILVLVSVTTYIRFKKRKK